MFCRRGFQIATFCDHIAPFHLQVAVFLQRTYPLGEGDREEVDDGPRQSVY